MGFVAIDFETANINPNSACSMGLAVVQDGCVVERKSWLVRPPTLNFYGPFINLHGITPDQVRTKPLFSEIWPEIEPYLHNKIAIAHNASFDMRVLQATLDTYHLHHPTFDYFCTVNISRRVWPNLTNHKLSTVADHVGFSFKHHDAHDDAHACAAIAIQACKMIGAQDLRELAGKIKCKQKTF